MTIQQAVEAAAEHLQAARFSDAEALCREILRQVPNHAEAWHLLGAAAFQTSRYPDAVRSVEAAIFADPQRPHYHNTLGLVRQAQGHFPEAATSFQNALRIHPSYAIAHYNLGRVLEDLGQLDAALAAYRSATRADPNYADAHYNLGLLLYRNECLDEAVTCFRTAITLRPDFAQGWNNLAGTLKNEGLLEEAISSYRRALALQPGDVACHSNLIYALHFAAEYPPELLAAELDQWRAAHETPVAPLPSRTVESGGANRRLRVGYLSPDFRDHVIGRNLLPLFENHSTEDFEIIAYSDHSGSDAVTERLRACTGTWRETEALQDDALAALIHDDRLDLLVDTTLHLGKNRLPVFAHQPAPIQVSFAGYPGRTGLRRIAHRISDGFLEADTGAGGVHLIESFWCYSGFAEAVSVAPPPSLAEDRLTFGCLNNACKINGPLLDLWAEILRITSHSRLLLMLPDGAEVGRNHLRQRLEAGGVAGARVEFTPPRARAEYLRLYDRVDIVLDPFPYNGHTTSLDALWMGVPVVSLAGATPVSRAGLSQLSHLGLTEFVAHSPEEYVRIAAGLALDSARLFELRRTLRERMKNSVLMDARGFARSIERIYHHLWRGACAEARS